jgi:hypothetical protein
MFGMPGMAKSDGAAAREQRLAAKLRENLRRRRQQAKARAESPPGQAGGQGEVGPKPGPRSGS